jgi:AraC-like DNA-binding protein
VLTWSTDEFRPHERFDRWREVRGRQLFGVTIELPPERRHQFHGRFSAAPVGGAMLASMSGSAYEVSRTEADIARAESDSLVIGRQVAGSGRCDTPAGRAFFDTGAVFIGNMDLPTQATPATLRDFHIRMLKIPLSAIQDGRAAARQLFLAPLHDARLALLVDAFASALIEEEPELADDAAPASGATAQLALLALLARGAVAAGSHESRLALRTGNRHAARRIMRRNLHRGDLSAEMVAAALGISPRQLHIVFEPTGQSFQSILAAMRVDLACRRLAAGPEGSIADLAFSCGFESLPTFYRAFRMITGRTPGEFRAG